MARLRRNFWVYSAGLGVAWALVIVIVLVAHPARASDVLLVLFGFAIGWVSTTIARFLYPPPRRWTDHGSVPPAVM